MVVPSLPDDRLAAGERLILAMDEAEFSPQAALWYYSPDAASWKLVLLIQSVQEAGPRSIYKRLLPLVAEADPDARLLPVNDVTVARPDSPIIQSLRAFLGPVPGIARIEMRDNLINGILIPAAFVYRLLPSEDS